MKKTLKLIWIASLALFMCALMFTACDGGQTSADKNNATSNGSTNNSDNKNEDTHVHDFGMWTTVKEATCTTDGSKERVCICGETETASISAIGHVEVIDAAVEAGCYNYGLTQGSHCETCGTTIIEQTEIAPKHNDPYGVCYNCNEVTNGDLAADTYVGIRSNALNTYVKTYYNGQLYVEYHFYNYDLEVYVSNTYDGKIYISVCLDLGAELIDCSSLYSGTGFVEYDVRMNGWSIDNGHASVNYNATSISWSTTLNSSQQVEFELYLNNYYM